MPHGNSSDPVLEPFRRTTCHIANAADGGKILVKICRALLSLSHRPQCRMCSALNHCQRPNARPTTTPKPMRNQKVLTAPRSHLCQPWLRW
ncbi:unnamed protein product [Periconia digitata]|uniref:Uncharacterized protein n=1 Tax=Periconia digitata TaxID=1303443 RepID=A0A9W4UU55_9PLEO|nr:unnamed protein product [Periconia digitata]